jgi:hypothetical protein
MTLEPIETAYRRLAIHVATCLQCQEAGGQDARPDDLCIAGRWYLQLWEFSTRQTAETMADAD